MAKYIPKIIQPLLNYVPSNGVEELVSYASKAVRAKIIYDRNFRGFEKADIDGGVDAYEFEDTGGPSKIYRDNINPTGASILTEGTYTFQPVEKQPRTTVTPNTDYISIVDIDYEPTRDDEKRYYRALKLPFVPRELTYIPESNFVGIASFGRNNPFYQFTGSEDTLTFEIDWFSELNNRTDVIFNCRWLEALTKADGYLDIPHRVNLVWGKDNLLWDDAIWILVSAPYKLTQFNRGYRSKSGEIISTSMLPQQAKQVVTFKRITPTNRQTQEIIGRGKVEENR